MRQRLVIFLSVILLIIIVVLFIGRGRPSKTSPLDSSVTGLSADQLLGLVQQQEQKLDYAGAKSNYKKLISEYFQDSRISDWQKKLEDINMKLIFSPTIQTESSFIHEVQPGDNLGKIAKKFKTTIELIKKINNLSNNNIRVGQGLKIWGQEFSVLVDKSQNLLALKADGEIIKIYKVATGKNNSTPVGTFVIKDRIINPVWYTQGKTIPPENPENILGTRWLGFDLSGYGIHGTNDPSNIGKQVTQGCVRMANTDVEELFIFLPIGSKVTVID